MTLPSTYDAWRLATPEYLEEGPRCPDCDVSLDEDDYCPVCDEYMGNEPDPDRSRE